MFPFHPSYIFTHINLPFTFKFPFLSPEFWHALSNIISESTLKYWVRLFHSLIIFTWTNLFNWPTAVFLSKVILFNEFYWFLPSDSSIHFLLGFVRKTTFSLYSIIWNIIFLVLGVLILSLFWFCVWTLVWGFVFLSQGLTMYSPGWAWTQNPFALASWLLDPQAWATTVAWLSYFKCWLTFFPWLIIDMECNPFSKNYFKQKDLS